ncbi:MAG: hypothetical protein NZ779_12455 [Alteromonas macleodii]|nr:hypothetical protein [Alteromonas macleodii]
MSCQADNHIYCVAGRGHGQDAEGVEPGRRDDPDQVRGGARTGQPREGRRLDGGNLAYRLVITIPVQV